MPDLVPHGGQSSCTDPAPLFLPGTSLETAAFPADLKARPYLPTQEHQ